jgi:hypothetical protein
MTTKEEIKRVRLIHLYLNAASARGDTSFTIRSETEELHYTADDVRAWPEMRNWMHGALAQHMDARSAQCKRGNSEHWVGWLNRAPGEECDESTRRGFVLWREMLAMKAPVDHSALEGMAEEDRPRYLAIDPAYDADPEFKKHCARINAENVTPDGKLRRWDRDQHDGKPWPSLDDRIAAARAELDRPVVKRLHEGRTDRALPMSNGRRELP